MAQLNQFSGGLNIRVAPHLINISEAQIYTNIDNSSISLKPSKSDTDEDLDIGQYFYNFKDNWISSDTYRTYQEFQNKLYYSDAKGVPQKSDDGLTWNNLGIKRPISKPTITVDSGEGNLSGTILYSYTYYNSKDGTESAPSDITEGISDVSNKMLRVDNIGVSDDEQVDMIRLYRIGGDLINMELVIELANGTTFYVDNIADIDVLGSVLDSYNNQQAPEGLNYLTESNSMFFGAVNSKLYYSDIAYVNYWGAFNFLDFDDTITGIGPIASGILVFTKYKTYIITGTSPSTLSKYLLSANQGCLAHKTIGFSYNMLIWLSSDGLCMSNGGDISVVSREKLGKLKFSLINEAIVYDDVYYLSVDNTILALDFRFGTIFKTINIKTTSFHLYNDILYYTYNNRLYSLGTSDDYNELHYKSPRLSDGSLSNLKNYKTVYVSCIGSLSVSILINGINVITKNIDNTTSEILIPQNKRLGYYLEFEIIGNGELLELQYVMETRANGRQ